MFRWHRDLKYFPGGRRVNTFPPYMRDLLAARNDINAEHVSHQTWIFVVWRRDLCNNMHMAAHIGLSEECEVINTFTHM